MTNYISMQHNVTIKWNFFYARAFNGSLQRTNLNQDLFEIISFFSPWRTQSWNGYARGSGTDHITENLPSPYLFRI